MKLALIGKHYINLEEISSIEASVHTGRDRTGKVVETPRYIVNMKSGENVGVLVPEFEIFKNTYPSIFY